MVSVGSGVEVPGSMVLIAVEEGISSLEGMVEGRGLFGSAVNIPSGIGVELGRGDALSEVLVLQAAIVSMRNRAIKLIALVIA